ncbi:bifunctional phosphoribosyl-AMP cyclohydrolase/phosphoribosyl-ATP diphosphatase HisIE [Buchnera aphidicola (Kurisakia onigurumii)]|uniref:bifunctional phosphoribosyl-AMP cyclohydrolase/phosphoribosyl-ATP diphosphatase HisIE n=1 Tax=Buchnera aphidicola TaxID=9 RepID=UPI0031B70F05
MINKNKIISLIDWKKIHGNIPVIVQNNCSGEVLMHAFMNRQAIEQSIETSFVTFYSRTKKRLWKKGETSGNFLKIKKIFLDCDNDCLLILVKPIGKTCHLDKNSCFSSKNNKHIPEFTFLYYLDNLIEHKKNDFNNFSYTNNLFQEGKKRIAQKVGEEAIEVVIAAIEKKNKDLIEESSDLIYHFLVLLHSHNLDLKVIIENLKSRYFIKNK